MTDPHRPIDKNDDPAWLEAIKKYRPVFERHGFDYVAHAIDFSDVSAESIRVMAEALEGMERAKELRVAGGSAPDRIASALERIAKALEGKITITTAADDYLVVDKKDWNVP